MAFEDLLERDLAIQLSVEGDEYGAQAAPGMGPEHPETLAGRGRGADGVAKGGVGVLFERSDTDAREGLRQVGVDEFREFLASRGADADGREALLGVAGVLLDVLCASASSRRRWSTSMAPCSTRISAIGRPPARVQVWKARTKAD